ncbi:hypothetical protein pipiens_018654, partial [Culex pipiens pipiens]
MFGSNPGSIRHLHSDPRRDPDRVTFLAITYHQEKVILRGASKYLQNHNQNYIRELESRRRSWIF